MDWVKKSRFTHHHIIPRSRGVDYKVTVLLPEGFHDAFHTIFDNLYGAEIRMFVERLEMMMKEQDSITNADLSKLRYSIKRRFL